MRLTNLSRLVFRQLVEKNSCTYTYIVGCDQTKKAAIIDPVMETVNRDAQIIKDLDLNIIYGLNTHVHADHITGTAKLKEFFPSMKSVLSAQSGGKADIFVVDGQILQIGSEELEVRATPGHTNGCISFVSYRNRFVMTGDALLIRSCGRTDFQEGNPHNLYRSVWEKILSLPDDYIVYVGHNYDGILQTSVAEEKKFNPRLTKTEMEFIEIMNNLNLSYPSQIDRALPANLEDGDIKNCKTR